MGAATKILQQIEADKIAAEKTLLTADAKDARFMQAVKLFESELNEYEQCLLDARREIEKNRKYKSRRHWVIKTQFIFNKMAEERHLSSAWISESKIKREWKRYIETVSEIAIRLTVG